jgi:hypothetical protein
MIFVEGDTAEYTGHATRGLIAGDVVTVVRANEDEEDDVLVECDGIEHLVQPLFLDWKEGR